MACIAVRPRTGRNTSTQEEPALRRRRGGILVAVPFFIMLLGVLTVLTVDWARIQLAKGELQAAVDAAALHAVTGVQEGTYRQRAQESLSDNRAGGRPLDYAPGDIAIGQWNLTGQQLDLLDPPDALAITARTEVELVFGGLVGVSRVKLSATAVAALGESVWGLTGIEGISLGGDAAIDSYDAARGPYSSTRRNRAVVSTNGDVILSGTAAIGGDIYVGPGRTVLGSNITGRVREQSAVREFEPVTLPQTAGNIDNSPLSAHLSGRSLHLDGNTHLRIPEGTYLVEDLFIAGSATLEATGPVTIYVTGEVVMAGTMKTSASAPPNLRIRVASDHNVRLMGTADFFGDIYAPTSRVIIGGAPGLFGKVVGGYLEVDGSVRLHHDERVERFQGRGNHLVR